MENDMKIPDWKKFLNSKEYLLDSVVKDIEQRNTWSIPTMNKRKSRDLAKRVDALLNHLNKSEGDPYIIEEFKATLIEVKEYLE